ncbi:MAG: uroporphyrinogen-III synthase [Micavibrio aeruginosavorus]|uniref:Uroporphyrinogen-III synthase n=1 Tax=Micavibrio aeruginosavorus TaxID=349221 RepID=A0A7T5R3B1_9BACT|nr:MAG: uroporphyrinogen-III synthase [Micavibrio aeruginosavorus]
MPGVILITRPEEDYAETATGVAALGFTPLSCPMLTIEAVPCSFDDIACYQALVFTSARALRPFCDHCAARDLPVFTVGDVTAERARALGFGEVISAGADLAALEAALEAAGLSGERPLLHISGADTVREIGVSGLKVERRVVYRAVQADALPEPARGALARGEVRAVLFYSPRTAEAFARVIGAARLGHQLMTTKALCLADSMVESVRYLPWRALCVASRPDRSGMQDLLAAEKEMDEIMSHIPENQSGTPNDQDRNAIEPAEAVIERFGGIRPMASKMNVPVTTVQGWKKRNVIPGNRREDVLRAATQNNIEISDILNQIVANENISAQAAAQAEAPAPWSQNAAASARPLADGVADTVADRELLMGHIRKAEKSAVTKSAAITVVLLSAAGLAAAILLGPGMRGAFDQAEVASKAEVQELRADVTRIDGDLSTLKQEHFSFKSLIPDDLGRTIGDMKQQAVDLKNSMTQLNDQFSTVTKAAEGITTDVLGPNAGDIQQRMAALEEQVRALTGSTDLGGVLQRIGTLKQSLEGQNLLSASADQLDAMLKNLGGDMSLLGPQLEAAQAQDTELAKTLEGVSQTDLKAAAMLLALTQFRSSLHRSAPFEEDLALLRSMVGEDDAELIGAIEKLAPQASKGVLTSKGLSRELKGLTGDIVVSSIKGEDVSIREKAAARVNDVFQVQKDGQLVTGTDTQAKIARAQKLLDEGNVDGAVVELQSLQGPALQTAQPVIDQAAMTALAQQVSLMLTKKVEMQLPMGGALSSGMAGMGGDIEGKASEIMEGLNSMSPDAIGRNLGGLVKDARDGGGKGGALYTTRGSGLDGVMQTIESMGDAVGAPGGGSVSSKPIFIPTTETPVVPADELAPETVAEPAPAPVAPSAE